jgi:hypothetical protein
MSGEWEKNKNTGAAVVYCDSNYDMTDRERRVRHNAYCRAEPFDKQCISETVKP